MTGRLEARFAFAKAEGRAALIAFITAGDPDLDRSASLLAALPGAGADIVELGMPFSDPVADGPTIQEASLRALAAGATTVKILAMVADFRKKDQETPIVLMGYYNPIHSYGPDRFATDARIAGVDGLIVVDLPPEEDAELRLPAEAAGLCLIRLITPTTDDARLPIALQGASGFLYYVSVAGVTGSAAADERSIAAAMARLRQASPLPIAVGFGIKTAEQAAKAARLADGVVVGSALVCAIAASLTDKAKTMPSALALVQELADGVRGARRKETSTG